ncbi:RrF2 family transcriptional regulator [Acidisoma sp. C75]
MLMRRERSYTAVAVMLDIGWHAGRERLESAGDIADRLAMARRGIEPVLQVLTRAGLLESLRGPRGGYRLGRSAARITLSQIVAAVTAEEVPHGEAAGGALRAAALEPLWQELEANLRRQLSGVTLAGLMQRAEAHGARRRGPGAAALVL